MKNWFTISTQVLKSICIVGCLPFVVKCLDEPCKTDTDCLPPNLRVPSYMRPVCTNEICSCPPDHQSSLYWNWNDQAIEFCLPLLSNSTGHCTENTGCTVGERCMPDSTCRKCTFGKFSSSTNSCEGPGHGELCHVRFDGYLFHDERLDFVKDCQGIGDGLSCDIHDYHTCFCDTVHGHYYISDSNECLQTPNVGDDCSSSNFCKNDQYGITVCSVNKTCICLGTVKNGTNTCIQRPDGACRFDLHCPDDSDCNVGRCECRNGYYGSQDGDCLPYMYGSTCQLNPDFKAQKALALHGLKCINGAYRCLKPMEQYYEIREIDSLGRRYKVPTCVINVGGSCAGTDDTRCTDGASCVDMDGHMICKCDEGYSFTSEQLCLKRGEFGVNCTDDCNGFVGLVCMDQSCQCLDSVMKYDPLVKRCLSPKWHFCGTVEIGDTSVTIECEGPLRCAASKGPVHAGLRCTIN